MSKNFKFIAVCMGDNYESSQTENQKRQKSFRAEFGAWRDPI